MPKHRRNIANIVSYDFLLIFPIGKIFSELSDSRDDESLGFEVFGIDFRDPGYICELLGGTKTFYDHYTSSNT